MKAILALMPLVLLHCQATEAQLRARAAYELNCPESSLTVDELDMSTRGVRGCGQRVIYVQDCSSQCKWVRDGR